MSFIKITDPLKREQIVKEYIATKKRIRDAQLAEKTGEIELQTDLSKFFKPITETQKSATKEITEGLKPIKEGIEQLPQAITFPAFPSIKAYDKSEIDQDDIDEIFKYMDAMDEEDEDPLLLIGPLAAKQLRRFTNKDEADTTYGIYDKKGKFYIGNKEAEILGDDLLIGNKTYEGTPGLWELIVAKKPDKSKYDKKDFDNNKEIMIKTDTLHRNNDPKNKFPKSSKAYKWREILNKFWNDYSLGKMGYGIFVIPSDPNALLERLDLLMASKKAGNTGVKNELVSFCDELKRQRILNSKAYKNLMAIIK